MISYLLLFVGEDGSAKVDLIGAGAGAAAAAAAVAAAAAAVAVSSSGNTGSASLKTGDINVTTSSVSGSADANVNMPPMSGDVNMPSSKIEEGSGVKMPSMLGGGGPKAPSMFGTVKLPAMSAGGSKNGADTAAMSADVSANAPSMSGGVDASACGSMPSKTGGLSAGGVTGSGVGGGSVDVNVPSMSVGGGGVKTGTPSAGLSGDGPSVSGGAGEASGPLPDASATVSVSPIRPLSASYGKVAIEGGAVGAAAGVRPNVSLEKDHGHPPKRLSSGSKISGLIAAIEGKSTPGSASASGGAGFGGSISGVGVDLNAPTTEVRGECGSNVISIPCFVLISGCCRRASEPILCHGTIVPRLAFHFALPIENNCPLCVIFIFICFCLVLND